MDAPAILLMFPGQGSQHPRMAAGLYGSEPAFTAAVDEVFDAYDEVGHGEGGRLRADWLSDRPAVPLDHVTRSQPLLFAVDYALGRAVTAATGRPWALLGHSVGEMAAAALAGVFTLRDAADLLLDRVRRLARAPAGGMLAVAAGEDALGPCLGDGEVVVAAVNSPRQTILAGPLAPLARVARTLREAGLTCREVPSLTAFHSPMLAPYAAGAAERFAATPVAAPSIPLRSGYRPGPVTGQLAADPSYWAGHPVETVRFWPALDAVLSSRTGVICLETGPGQGLSTLARRHPTVRSGQNAVVPLLPPRAGTAEADRTSVAAALAVVRERGTVLSGRPGR
ncbi:acyltransferase domain-containing protein [Streptomyces prasinopilosus]|uniref:acyltransferase domain-containing protein n=1 Tax=Streptomyces prasinopilosus TaxID=67344 RepID=UPI0006EBB61C|nr:acyltransferase domain-containing protein [Streptomyces prasinopilosus]